MIPSLNMADKVKTNAVYIYPENIALYISHIMQQVLYFTVTRRYMVIEQKIKILMTNSVPK